MVRTALMLLAAATAAAALPQIRAVENIDIIQATETEVVILVKFTSYANPTHVIIDVDYKRELMLPGHQEENPVILHLSHQQVMGVVRRMYVMSRTIPVKKEEIYRVVITDLRQLQLPYEFEQEVSDDDH